MIAVGTKIRVVKGSLKGGRIDKGTTGRVRVVQDLGVQYNYAVRVDVEFLNSFAAGKVVSFYAHHKNRLADAVVRLRGLGLGDERVIEVVTVVERPALGATLKVRGEDAKVVAVHPAGTADVTMPSGQTLRVTGLGWA